MNFDEALKDFRQGTVEGQENPLALIFTANYGRFTSTSGFGTTRWIR